MNLDTASGYRPRTQETRAAYEAVLAFIREQFGDQPQDVLKGAAEEVLAVLKDDRKRVRNQKASVWANVSRLFCTVIPKLFKGTTLTSTAVASYTSAQ